MQASDFKKTVKFEYKIVNLSDIRLTSEKLKSGKTNITAIHVGDEEFTPSGRFMVSLQAKFGFTKAFFAYFEPAEVIARICQVNANDNVRVAIARFTGGMNQLLGISDPKKAIANGDEILDLIGSYGSESMTYDNGMITSVHSPRVAASYEICSDQYDNKFAMSAPIDGYGSPYVTIGAQRVDTATNIMPKSKVFRTDLKLGKGNDDLNATIGRALDSFNSDEGFSALRMRLEASSRSWGSISEAMSIHDQMKEITSTGRTRYEVPEGVAAGKSMIMRGLPPSTAFKASEIDIVNRGQLIVQSFHGITGNIQEQYGFANMDVLSEKRKRSLPVKASVLELINFASEIAKCTTYGADRMHERIGAILSSEYDMEESKATYSSFDAMWQQRMVGTAVQEDLAGQKN